MSCDSEATIYFTGEREHLRVLFDDLTSEGYRPFFEYFFDGVKSGSSTSKTGGFLSSRYASKFPDMEIEDGSFRWDGITVVLEFTTNASHSGLLGDKGPSSDSYFLQFVSQEHPDVVIRFVSVSMCEDYMEFGEFYSGNRIFYQYFDPYDDDGDEAAWPDLEGFTSSGNYKSVADLVDDMGDEDRVRMSAVVERIQERERENSSVGNAIAVNDGTDERPGFPFPLDRTELLRLKEIADRAVEKLLYEEYEPGRLKIDRARERRNPAYFEGTFDELREVAIQAWALGEVDAARESLRLMPDMLTEALAFDLDPGAGWVQVAISFATITGRRSLVTALVDADQGLDMSRSTDNRDDLDNPISWWNRCVGDLVIGNDESVRSSVEAVTEDIAAVDLPSDRALLSAQAAMLLAVVNADAAALEVAARGQNDRLCGILASVAKPEQSEGLLDAPTTAVLAISSRRGMAIPEDLPTCPVQLIVDKWVD